MKRIHVFAGVACVLFGAAVLLQPNRAAPKPDKPFVIPAATIIQGEIVGDVKVTRDTPESAPLVFVDLPAQKVTHLKYESCHVSGKASAAPGLDRILVEALAITCLDEASGKRLSFGVTGHLVGSDSQVGVQAKADSGDAPLTLSHGQPAALMLTRPAYLPSLK